MNDTAITPDEAALIDDIYGWAHELAGGAKINMQALYPGFSVVVCDPQETSMFSGSHGRVHVTDQAIYPQGWTLPAVGVSLDNEENRHQPPISEPTLYRYILTYEDGTQFVRFCLYFPREEPNEEPTEETKQEPQRNQRREYARRVRARLEKRGMKATQIKQLFNAAGVGSAVDAADLASKAKKACHGRRRALGFLLDVSSARGRTRRLAKLARAGVRVDFGSDDKLRRAVAGAIVLLKASDKLSENSPREHVAVLQEKVSA